MPGALGEEYILIQTVEQGKRGINGGLYRQATPEDKPRNVIGVASIDETLRKVASLGGTILQSKMPIPGIGWFALLADPEGNLLGVLQEDSKAT